VHAELYNTKSLVDMKIMKKQETDNMQRTTISKAKVGGEETSRGGE
jgi:hypothetical protein